MPQVVNSSQGLGIEAVEITYDPEADAAYIYIKGESEMHSGEVKESFPCDFEIKNGAIILEFDSQRRLIGLEILGASRILPSAVIESAERPTAQ